MVAGLFLGLSACAAFWSSACATSNGDAVDDEEVGPSSSSGSSRSGSTTDDGEGRPAFDASFPEEEQDANVDPTPPGGGDTCVDNDDPGGAENVAKDLGETSDCNSAGTKTVKGVMNGAVDVDFYKFSMKDEFSVIGSCSINADIGSTTSGLELCVFARCKNQTADAVTGCKQGVLTTSTIGMKGCCAATPGKAVPDWDCSGLSDNDSADFVVRVKQLPGGDKCLPYSFSYTF